MSTLGRQIRGLALLATILAMASVLGQSRPVGAVEAGEPAPEFKLASTNGLDIALSDFAGKKWVFLEFYALDFSPA
jgi:AhpC/TSA family protein